MSVEPVPTASGERPATGLKTYCGGGGPGSSYINYKMKRRPKHFVLNMIQRAVTETDCRFSIRR